MPDNNRTPYAVELDLARDAAEEAGALVLERQRTIQSIEFKGDTDLVTDVDRASEALIVERIQRRFPDDTILAEEGSGHGLGSDERRIWLIDPLDGTTNYAHGFPIYAVSIALVVDERPAVGVVHVPALRETFVAERAQGVSLNGDPVSVSRTEDLTQAIVASGFAYDPDIRMANMPFWSEFVAVTRGVRRTGAAAFDLCCVGCGRYDGYWEQGASAWDVAAGWLIVEEAGGRVTNYEGGMLDIFGAEILAANAAIHPEMMNLISRVQHEVRDRSESTIWDPTETK